MGMILGGWADEPTNTEIFNEITGCVFNEMSDDELMEEIRILKENNWTSRIEQKRLMDLEEKIRYGNQ